MSESAYSGESYHSGNRDKYKSSGESMFSSESSYEEHSPKYGNSYDSTTPHNEEINNEATYENQQVIKAKDLLRKSEAHLIQKALILSVDKNEVREVLRNIMVRYEDEIIQYPNSTTLLNSFNALYEDNSRLKPEMKQLFVDGLNELEFEEKKNNSKLKYW